MVVPPVCEKALRDDADAAVVAKVGGEPCDGIRCEPSIPHAIVPLRGSAEVCRQMKYRGRRAAIQHVFGDPTCAWRSNLRLAIQPVSIKPQNHALFPFAPGRGLLLSASSQIDRILEAYLGRSAQKLHPLFAGDGKHGRLDCLFVCVA
ncbi:MAG: hypothetical protein U0M51_02435 [Eggerthellaceae bacterium]